MDMKQSAVFGFWILFFCVEFSLCLNVHFEHRDGGFFLKQSSRQNLQPTLETSTVSGYPLSVDRFTVLQSTQPISIRAIYGPFSTKQTVPARYVIPDPIPVNTSGAPVDLQDLVVHHLDISAHIVRTEIPRDSPVLRVLFHTGSDPVSRRQIFLAQNHEKLCIIVRATMGNFTPLQQVCNPNGEDGVCLVQITIPSSWWPPLPSPSKDGRPGKASKSPPRLVQITYSVVEPHVEEAEGCQSRLQVQPSIALGSVPLVPAKAAYKELRLADSITILVPQSQVYPLSRFHIPVFIDREKERQLNIILIRCRIKSGLRLLHVEPNDNLTWNMTAEINPRYTGGIITLVRTEPPKEETSSYGEITELFSLLVEVYEDSPELYEGARMVWSVKFEPHDEKTETMENQKENRKHVIQLDVQKDDIQAVVPISKNWEVLNTAVLTGKQVSQAMKIFIVSQAGKAADITFQASCHSEDDSVLKVSSSCSSVYVDGSEVRGSVNGSVLVKYGSYTGLARFTVWMPEFPLDLQVPDTRLSQLKMWKVPTLNASVKTQRKKRSYRNWAREKNSHDDSMTCKLRYQQSSVDVYARFMASDHSSGRVTYFINRRTWLRITDLVLPLLRVSDPRIASLNGRVLQGRSMGRTEVQVLSPITGRVIGAKEIRVGNDKVGLEKLIVQIVSGLQLNISPDSSINNGYIAETRVTRKLTAQYQEGLLDIELEFSDGNRIPLREVSEKDYHLIVESSDPEVVAFAPMVASHHPRVIAVGEGSGDLLHVTLLLPEECRASYRYKMAGNGALVSADASVVVDFSSSDIPNRQDILQNDGGSYSSSKREPSDLQDILKGSLSENDKKQSVDSQARQYRGDSRKNHNRTQAQMTSLEISMYVLLAAFCFAIVIFVVSCVVYASKFKPVQGVLGEFKAVPLESSTFQFTRDFHHKQKQPVANVHDWVWLGRSSVEFSSKRNSANPRNSREMKITTNPLNANYHEPEDALRSDACEVLNPVQPQPSRPVQPVHVDSTTYCKSRKMRQEDFTQPAVEEVAQVWNKPMPPPPLPPHAVSPSTLIKRKIMQNPNDIEEYRPPVPPHRNIGVTVCAKIPEVEKYANHTQERNKSQLEDISSGKSMRNVFEFDDDPQDEESNAASGVTKPHTKKPETENDDVHFVHIANASNVGNRARNNSEVKRATIVGTPMFSTKTTSVPLDKASAEQLPHLDDLQLEMDYEQIMRYFENLKESNA